ncbi:MAG: Serine/threonine-protein kinase PrkC [Deltaproteobacteria bacterium ADurb.Bin058]|nr:MAG: Serine/threonine-protein kinase PrkC [Deltaproteobacteria bacterium ADurb.Bin058]
MIVSENQVVTSESGDQIRVGRFISGGGQGEAYVATKGKSGQKGVLKVFHQQFVNSNTLKRLRFLLGKQLHTECPVLFAPVDLLVDGNILGHYTPFAEGQSLEHFLGQPNSTFIQQIQLAIALAHAISVMHNKNIAHGDLHSENLIIERVGSVLKLHVIDFDNFNAFNHSNAPIVPSPPCVGHNLYIAPELREAFARRKPAIPRIESDRYALGVLMHEIILLSHPAAGNDNSEEEFNQAMCLGEWHQDPASPNRPQTNQGGYPATVLNADIRRLFRLAFDLDPARRPTSDDWQTALANAFHRIYDCPHCNRPFIINSLQFKCPWCNKEFPHLSIRVNRSDICLINGSTVIGRTELGGSQQVSGNHALLSRDGPLTWLESRGRNGTYRWNGSGWTRLPDRPVLVQAGDRLRFADVEVRLV